MNIDQRESFALQQADLRLVSLKNINPNLDIGEGISITEFINKIEDTRQTLSQLNSDINQINKLSWSLRQKELEMAELSRRLQSAIASIYGKKSDQYYMLTGTSPNSRKSSKRPSDSEESSPATPEDAN